MNEARRKTEKDQFCKIFLERTWYLATRLKNHNQKNQTELHDISCSFKNQLDKFRLDPFNFVQ